MLTYICMNMYVSGWRDACLLGAHDAGRDNLLNTGERVENKLRQLIGEGGLKEVMSAFASFDSNKDGTLSLGEACRCEV